MVKSCNSDLMKPEVNTRLPTATRAACACQTVLATCTEGAAWRRACMHAQRHGYAVLAGCLHGQSSICAPACMPSARMAHCAGRVPAQAGWHLCAPACMTSACMAHGANYQHRQHSISGCPCAHARKPPACIWQALLLSQKHATLLSCMRASAHCRSGTSASNVPVESWCPGIKAHLKECTK